MLSAPGFEATIPVLIPEAWRAGWLTGDQTIWFVVIYEFHLAPTILLLSSILILSLLHLLCCLPKALHSLVVSFYSGNLVSVQISEGGDQLSFSLHWDGMLRCLGRRAFWELTVCFQDSDFNLSVMSLVLNEYALKMLCEGVGVCLWWLQVFLWGLPTEMNLSFLEIIFSCRHSSSK